VRLKEKKDVLVIIPAYNEEAGLKNVIGLVNKTMPEADVVVVDDGSIDMTTQTACEAGAVVLTHPFNMGYGVALQTGYKYAWRKDYNYILQMDADGQHEPACLNDMLRELYSGVTDVVIGSRFLHKESYSPPLCRKIGIKFFAVLASALIGQKITDPTSGFQGHCGKVLKFLVSDYFPVDYPDTDVIIMIHKYGFRIKEIPVVMRSGSGESMHSGTKPVYYMFKMMLSVLVTLLRQRKT